MKGQIVQKIGRKRKPLCYEYYWNCVKVLFVLSLFPSLPIWIRGINNSSKRSPLNDFSVSWKTNFFLFFHLAIHLPWQKHYTPERGLQPYRSRGHMILFLLQVWWHRYRDLLLNSPMGGWKMAFATNDEKEPKIKISFPLYSMVKRSTRI